MHSLSVSGSVFCSLWPPIIVRKRTAKLNAIARKWCLFVRIFIVFLGKINNFHQTASKFFENFPFRCFRIEIILLTIVGLRNDTLYGRLNDIGRNEIAWFLGRYGIFRLDAVVVPLTVRSFHQRCIVKVGRITIVVVLKCLIDISATYDG